ncbi:TPA: hypothetical protein ACKR1B_003717 [Pseudomonas aeruginosa]|nr:MULTISPECIES: hypothetical protein [Pseudomonas]HCL2752769.1 hypothetical protein [Pseudomonas aeruginosa 449A]AMT99524.1 hypothetical protein OB07_01135 [Pseudomonas aeruginosa]EIU1435777.1 hypothetical protein [Pseudomonas aeruginosa]EIU3397484.1 hypothetical protein [Pseudomonas aeruginosa]EIU3792803.1 hypothetical protein [Pseudomonas aeruginosa]
MDQNEQSTFDVEQIKIRYEGGDADRHELDMLELGESLQGFARLYSTVANFVETGVYSKQWKALEIRAYATEPKAKCFEMGMLLSWASQTQVLSGLAAAIIGPIIAYILMKLSNQKDEMKHLREILENQLKERYGSDSAIINRMMDTIDRLADASRPSAKKALSPIGSSCHHIEAIGTGYKGVFDQAMKDAIQSEDGDELTGQISLEILITELDVEKQTCKFRLLNEPDQTDEDGNPLRFSGKITDPEIESQGNKYSMSLALGTPLKAKGKARMRDGYIKIFFISDAE